ncbi:glycoside hydrolase [Auriculariales sp. MPI-PUGE-AT-0066]|nr:glycoside hydrolase [Auriculariales sp. MPI-PUGE-AT-0066]
MRAFFAVLGLISLVSAHGYVQQVTANGRALTSPADPYLSPTPSRVIRKVPGNGPVQDLSLIDIHRWWCCGQLAAALTATIAAGSSLTVNWTTWPDSHLGPIVTYLARAPSDITAWSPGSSAVWFKVAQSGYSNGTLDILNIHIMTMTLDEGVWASTTLIKNNGIYSFTIPSSLKAGQYIVRHENIALHAAYTYPGVQIYPSCIQITVTGSGSATGPSSLVSFPGAYTASTPGIVFDVYQGNSSTYVIPGPAVWTG